MARTKTAASLETLELLLDEALDAYRELEGLYKKLRRLKRGSEAYLDLLPDIAVCASVITAKSEAVIEEIDDIEDAMPDDD